MGAEKWWEKGFVKFGVFRAITGDKGPTPTSDTATLTQQILLGSTPAQYTHVCTASYTEADIQRCL